MFVEQMVPSALWLETGKQRADDESPVHEFIEAVQVRPNFHPIIDLFTGSVLGFEVLSCGAPPFDTPCKMFEEARRLGATWDFEKACRVAALKKIASLPESFRSSIFFINVSPDIFSDPRFVERFTQARLQEYGLDQRQIVIEITEKKTFSDYRQFEKLVSQYTDRGFKIALDDFGSGYSGLITLIASTPHYLKLDMAIVRDVHKYEYKQKLVKSVTSFASSVNARLIAEGVESCQELEVLVKYGVRYTQGFLFGKPREEPYLLSDDLKKDIATLVKKYDHTKVDIDERVGSLVIRPMTIEKGSINCQSMGQIFKKTPHLDHAVILDAGNIVGLMTRQHFYYETGGAFGYPLFQKKPIETICKHHPLIVEEKNTVTTLAKLAMDRFQDDLYDPVLVVDAESRFMGTVTMKQVITKAVELEVRCAMSANPLTNLPGNEVIRHWIHDAFLWPEYSIIYADLDHFKGFNDSYGFLMGDELLCLAAKVLARWRDSLSDARLGHVGGDDFVIVSREMVTESALDALCKIYDYEKLDLFKAGDIERGFMEVIDRQGHPIKAPLVTLSLAVINSSQVWDAPHPALFSEVAASLKKKVKQMTYKTGKSGYMFEQRLHREEKDSAS
ncbi:MAG: GGDEF domain-containing protein [Pseudomonadota bacterium]